MPNNQPARAVLYFSDEYLEHCKQLTPTQILTFIDQFQRLHKAREMNAESNRSQPADRRRVE